MTDDEAKKELEVLATLSGEDRIEWLLEVVSEARCEGRDERDGEVSELNDQLDSLWATSDGATRSDLEWLRTRIEMGDKADALMIVDRIERGLPSYD